MSPRRSAPWPGLMRSASPNLCPRRARARSCGGSCAISPAAVKRPATPQRWRITRCWRNCARKKNEPERGIESQIMTESLHIDVANLGETEAFGRRLAGLLFPGAVVGLVGPLGAGKTHLVRAIAEGLDIAHPGQVSSPTFVLIQEYDARLPIYHFDAYRLPNERAFAELGVHEYFEGQ